MRINARLDEKSSDKLEYITRTTQASVTEVIREAIEHYYVFVRQKHPDPRILLAESGFVGCAEGDPDLSTTYKEVLSQDLGEKHGHR